MLIYLCKPLIFFFYWFSKMVGSILTRVQVAHAARFQKPQCKGYWEGNLLVTFKHREKMAFHIQYLHGPWCSIPSIESRVRRHTWHQSTYMDKDASSHEVTWPYHNVQVSDITKLREPLLCKSLDKLTHFIDKSCTNEQSNVFEGEESTN